MWFWNVEIVCLDQPKRKLYCYNYKSQFFISFRIYQLSHVSNYDQGLEGDGDGGGGGGRDPDPAFLLLHVHAFF